MKQLFRIMAFLALALTFNSAFAGGMAFNERDCEEILRRWAEDPTSVPQSLVDACKEVLAAESTGSEKTAAGDVVDPCEQPNASDLINCWGPWASLAPAAGGGLGPIVLPPPEPTLRCDQFCDDIEEIPEPPPPVGEICTPGAGCGFATIDQGPGTTPEGDAVVVRFDMETDGSQFVVDPGGTGELTSLDGLTRSPTPGPARYQRVEGDIGSQLIVFQGGPDGNGYIKDGAGLWRHGDTTLQEEGSDSAGVFAWGITSSMATMESLNAGNVTANFSGTMSGNTGTQADITVNFGSQPDWNGSWQNVNYNFNAGGMVQGVDLISEPGQFSANVISGEVQGALLGEAGSQSIAHSVDVVLDNGMGGELEVNDVGLLRQVP